MKSFFSVLCILILIKCSSSGVKESSGFINKDAPFIKINLDINPVSKDSIIVYLSYTNTSSDTILLYKTLLPDNYIYEDIFGIFSPKSYTAIKYTGKRTNKYLSEVPGGEVKEEDIAIPIIVPELKPENFVHLLPGKTLLFKSNLARFYRFSPLLSKGENYFAVSPKVLMPAISINGKQLYEIDSLDNQEKPVYYDIALPPKENIDSMRVWVTIPLK